MDIKAETLLFSDFKNKLQCSVFSSSPVSGGYLNSKWKVATDRGTFFLKQYSPKRYSQKKIEETECALRRQTIVWNLGVLCPKLFEHEGIIIQRLNEDLWYMAMEYVDGELLPREKAEPTHMLSLGKACAQMHKTFQTIPVFADVFQYKNTRDQLYSNYENCLQEAKEIDIPEYLRAVKKQMPILESIDDRFFEKIPKGFTHLDFAGDNILFQGEQVSAIA